MNEVRKVNNRMLCFLRRERGELATGRKDEAKWRREYFKEDG